MDEKIFRVERGYTPDAELLSLASFFKKAAGVNIAVYLHNIPQGHVYPALYFPTPEISGEPLTLSGAYTLTKTVYAKVFDNTVEKAGDIASRILEEICANKYCIEELEPDGLPSGRYLNILNPRLVPVYDGTGSVELTVSWNSSRIRKAEEIKISELYISAKSKQRRL